MREKLAIFFTGVGGQGTLTATNLLAKAALDKGLDVTAGEIHGMAQRGGVVESTVLIGGFRSPRIAQGEADALLGFEPVETLRALPYLKPKGLVFSSTDPIPPASVSTGKEPYPDLDAVKTEIAARKVKAVYLPIRQMGLEAGAAQSGNLALLGAFLASGIAPLGPEDLIAAIEKNMKPALAEINRKAVLLGAAAVR